MAARLSTLALVATVLISGQALADSNYIQWDVNKHVYKRFDKTMDWHQARTFCQKQGAYLVTITSQDENDFVWNELAGKSRHTGGVWLGATNDRTAVGDKRGPYEWVTGEPWEYSNWNPGTGEPNNSSIVVGSGEHYAQFFPAFVGDREGVTPGCWNDISSLNKGALWNPGQYGVDSAWRPVSTICEWGGNFTSTSF